VHGAKPAAAAFGSAPWSNKNIARVRCQMYRYPNALAPEGATSFTFAPELPAPFQLDIAVATANSKA